MSVDLNGPRSSWPSRILRLRTIGRPASWSVESCEVNCVSDLSDVLPRIFACF
jgi:hypothetical protein